MRSSVSTTLVYIVGSILELVTMTMIRGVGGVGPGPVCKVG